MFDAKKMFDVRDVYGHGKRLFWIKEEIEYFINANKLKFDTVKILDVGCGTGLWLTLPIASLGYDIIGIDPDKDSIEYGKRINLFNNCRLENVYLEEVDDAFDVILISEVLEHVKNPEYFLRELKRLLKPNGILLITVPNGFGWFEFESLLWRIGFSKIINRFLATRFAPLQPEETRIPASLDKETSHVNHFTIRTLKKFFNDSGFCLKKIKGATLISGPISNAFLSNCRSFLKINEKIIDGLPLWMAADWYIALSFEE